MTWASILLFYTGNMNLVLLLSGLLFGNPNANVEVDLTLQGAHSDAIEHKWLNYKREFGKSYLTLEEELRGKRAFIENNRMIEEHNRLYEQGRFSYTLGHNQFSDEVDQEFLDEDKNKSPPTLKYEPPTLKDEPPTLKYEPPTLKYEPPTLKYEPPTLKYEPPTLKYDVEWPEVEEYEALSSFIDAPIPISVDWRAVGAVTAVKDEGNCRASWAFSATGALEGQLFRSTHHLQALSEQHLIDCVSKQKHNGCKRGSAAAAFSYIKQNGGIAQNATYFWKGKQNFFCHYKRRSSNPTVHGIVHVKSGNEVALAASVAKTGPVAVAVDGTSNKFKFYKSGIYHNDHCSKTVLTREMVVVGYTASSWLLKNSWGKKWGVEGYMFLQRGSNQCGVATRALYPIV